MHTINGKQVYTIQEAFAYAMAIGKGFSRDGLTFDENCQIGISMNNGVLEHIWLHAVRKTFTGGDLYRVEITASGIRTFVWPENSKKSGWQPCEL